MVARGGMRRRFAVWFGLLSAGLVVVFSAVIYGTLWFTTIEGLDRELSVRAEQLLGRCKVVGAELEFDAAGADELVLEGLASLHSVEVRAWPGGRLLFGLGAPRPESGIQQPAPIDTTYTLRHRTLEQEGESEAEDFDDRVCELVAPPPGAKSGAGQLVQVRIAADVEALENRLEGYLLPLVGLGGLFVLAGGLIGRSLAGRLVEPILDLRTAAQRAQSGEGMSMPRSGRGDELDDLAEVLEASFTGLEAALDRQRRFTADAAHELRNPLSAVLSAAEIALRKERSAEASEAFFRDIHLEAQRMAEALEALLLLARCDARTASASFLVVDLHHLLEEVVRSRPKTESQFRTELTGPARVLGDPALLRLLFENLLANAERFGPPGEEIHVELKKQAGWIHVSIADRGSGIPTAHRELVFERFFRTEPRGAASGTAGLGLAIARAVTELHGGRIEALDVAVGATLHIQFPEA